MTDELVAIRGKPLYIISMFSTPITSLWPRRWLQLAVLSLAVSGVFSIILVVSRTPQLIAHFPWMKELFSVSLVIHVDLSVLVWFLAMTGVLWSLALNKHPVGRFPFANAASWGAVLAGVLCMSFSPLMGEWTVVKSNYVPVITNATFFAGLALLLVGMSIGLMQVLCAPPRSASPLEWGVYSTAPILLVALCCFSASANGIPPGTQGLAFYENLFWAGGHILQFVYVQIMLIAWLVLAESVGLRSPPNLLKVFVLLIGPLASLLAFAPYFLYPVMSQEHMDAFSLLMNAAMGVGGGILGLWYLYAILKRDSAQSASADSQNDSHPAGGVSRSAGSYPAYRAALYASFILFIVGGAFGVAINGPNVRIPAHYHGSIVAVTLALMGLAYYLMPMVGGRDVASWRAARIQPWFYAIGQLLHITGLAISGGYGVLRKSVGDTGVGGWEVKAALGMMGGGGLLAIIGGLIFVVVMLKGFQFRRVGSR